MLFNTKMFLTEACYDSKKFWTAITILVLCGILGSTVMFGQLPTKRPIPTPLKHSVQNFGPATIDDYQRVIKLLEEERQTICSLLRVAGSGTKSQPSLPSVCKFDTLPNGANIRKPGDREAEIKVCSSWGMPAAGLRPGWCFAFEK
jgi:hypothetical protein